MLALTPACEPAKGGRARCGQLLVSAIEHPSVRSGGRFAAAAIHEFDVTPEGIADLSDLERRLTELSARNGGPTLVSVMAANNETGVVQPVREIAQIVHAAGGLLHVDAVQVAGRISFDINVMEVDLLSISSHKLGGPTGVGAVVRRAAAPGVIDPQMKGGGQERGARAGTENVSGIAGFGAAAAAARDDLASGAAWMRVLRDRLEAGLKRGPVTIFRRSRPPVAQHHAVRSRRHQGGNCADQPRPRGLCGVFGVGVLVGQGRRLACAGGDGRHTGARFRRDPGEHRADHHRKRDRFVPGGLEKARCGPI